ncbi:MAG TPA: carbohydrate kinase family protein [Bryobacteraceae bacterium]|nr:carbohydrate kinase family protein [Bryobacteraceae bacterium]
MRRRFDVLCAGDMCVDLLLRGDVRPRFGQVEQIIEDYRLELGGSSNIFASQFAKLGGSVCVIGWVGADAFGDAVVAKLADAGIDISLVRRSAALKTGLGVALTEQNDRAILTYLGTIDAIGPEDLDGRLLTSCKHWHVASYFLMNRVRSCWPRWFAECRAANVTTSLDPNWDPEERWDRLWDVLPLIDVFLPNEAEAIAIAAEDSLETAGEKLASACGVVVVKRGAEGAIAFAAGRRYEAPRPLLEAPAVDTVGAGDNFDAGFLRGWLLGWDIPRSLELATHCAVASLAAPGGVENQLRGFGAGGTSDD